MPALNDLDLLMKYCKMFISRDVSSAGVHAEVCYKSGCLVHCCGYSASSSGWVEYMLIVTFSTALLQYVIYNQPTSRLLAQNTRLHLLHASIGSTLGLYSVGHDWSAHCRYFIYTSV